jgi:hypothetical protein
MLSLTDSSHYVGQNKILIYFLDISLTNTASKAKGIILQHRNQSQREKNSLCEGGQGNEPQHHTYLLPIPAGSRR